MSLLLALLSLPVLLAVVVLAMRQVRRRRMRRAWRELAPRLELSLAEGERLVGRYRGLPVEVVLTGSASQVRMAVQGELPSGLHLSRQHPGARRLRGVRDIQVGDGPLDDAALVQATHPAATIRLLREPAVRDALLELLAAYPQAVITENEVVVPLEKQPEEELARRVLRSEERLASALGVAASRFLEQARDAREQVRREPLPPSRPALPRQLPTAAQPRTSEPSLRALRETFAMRRWVFSLISYPVVFSGWGTMAYGIFIRKRGLEFAIPGPILEMVGITLFAAGVLSTLIGGYFLMRCTACGGSLSTGNRSRPYETEVCPHCQMRLSY